jgi:arylformamidase
VTRVIDVSLEIGPDLLIWPGNPGVSVTPTSRIAQGGSSNVSEIRLGSHTGTHIDPPSHFLDDGASAEDLPLDVMMGKAIVADLRGTAGPIGPDELNGLPLTGEVTRLLLLTDNSALWGAADPLTFPEGYVCLSPEGARWVVGNGIRLIGIDFLSIEVRGAPGHPTHRTLLEAGVVILEGLDLSGVEPGEYSLVCFPLKIAGGDGAPTRAVLLQD